jgi:hypothetical protein
MRLLHAEARRGSPPKWLDGSKIYTALLLCKKISGIKGRGKGFGPPFSNRTLKVNRANTTP